LGLARHSTISTLEPEADGGPSLDPFLAEPQETEARSSLSRISTTELYKVMMQTVVLSIGSRSLYGHRCWFQTGTDAGVEVVVLREASDGLAAYGIRAVLFPDVLKLYPHASFVDVDNLGVGESCTATFKSAPERDGTS
jgi:hypothetical protein